MIQMLSRKRLRVILPATASSGYIAACTPSLARGPGYEDLGFSSYFSYIFRGICLLSVYL